MDNQQYDKKVVVGFVVYNENTAKYLPDFLLSLKKQTWQDFDVFVFNNGDETGENIKLVKNSFPTAEIIGGGDNLGFARAYNQLLRRARELGTEYFFITNPDMVYNDDALEKLVGRLDSDRNVGAACPKILRWDFAKKEKTDFIDTCGLNFKEGLMFYDVGQGEKDDLSWRYPYIIAPGGASGLWRMEDLERIKEDSEYFDERMFMYKEDCDLAYRFFLSEGEVSFVPEAIGWHDRTAALEGKGNLAVIKARRNKSEKIRRWSVVNQEILFRKYWHLQSQKSKMAITIYRLKVLTWILLFERFLLKDYLKIGKIKRHIRNY
jgi:GT2 family glycosyltransferase